MLADFQTIIEKKGSVDGLTMAYFGDLDNNVTYDLMRLAALMGYNCNLAGVGEIEAKVWEEVNALKAKTGAKVQVFKTAQEAAKDVDVIYCDSWMSYGTPSGCGVVEACETRLYFHELLARRSGNGANR